MDIPSWVIRIARRVAIWEKFLCKFVVLIVRIVSGIVVGVRERSEVSHFVIGLEDSFISSCFCFYFSTVVICIDSWCIGRIYNICHLPELVVLISRSIATRISRAYLAIILVVDCCCLENFISTSYLRFYEIAVGIVEIL